PGYVVARHEDKLGHRTCDTCQIVLKDMFVPEQDLLGELGEGYKISLAYLMGGRIAVAAQAVGVAQAALNAAVEYAQARVTFGKRLVEHQAIAFKLADMATQVESGRQMVMHATQMKAAELPCLREASMAKLYTSEMAEKVCSEAIQIHGGYGYLSDFPVEKYYRDARVLQIYEGSSEVQKMLISREFSKL
ncbi:MAG: acyl-CoA dehydrogenase family protein, partial [Pseudomonadota bacterium]